MTSWSSLYIGISMRFFTMQQEYQMNYCNSECKWGFPSNTGTLALGTQSNSSSFVVEIKSMTALHKLPFLFSWISYQTHSYPHKRDNMKRVFLLPLYKYLPLYNYIPIVSLWNLWSPFRITDIYMVTINENKVQILFILDDVPILIYGAAGSEKNG